MGLVPNQSALIRHCERSEAIHRPVLDCFASLAMTSIQLRSNPGLDHLARNTELNWRAAGLHRKAA